MLEFLRQIGLYLVVNTYPFFAYGSLPSLISLYYALFRENPGVVDSHNGLRYLSLFDAQIDAVYAAMSALKHDDIKMVVIETGWPSKGDPNEAGAGLENAAAYNGNLVCRVLTGGPVEATRRSDRFEGLPGQLVSGSGERLTTPMGSGEGNFSASASGQTWCVENGEAGKAKL
ncbi:O-Glycosyl hydrolases family 17 protein [Actinidia rufa]|uniref:O-Glycosyl hydrolases family 17 protein n=1 Tax=Actinidia rufa TaxID=165716 RepID=A0A7J0DGU9_9ERIC|nr:O-Glycosyl hydrolases family 17 protein [Actinidia rufa]